MIPPGGEGEIKVTLRPKGAHTEIEKKITVISDDPKQSRFTLTMKGTLLIDMVAQPPSVSIANLAPGQPGTTSFSLELSPGSVATVKSVSVQDTEHFSIRSIETEVGSLATYEVRFAGRDDVGTSSTNVTIETTGDNTPQLTIPVSASAAYNLVYPKRIALVRRGTGPLEQTVRISTRRGGPPEIGKVEDPDGLLDVEVLEPSGSAVGIHLRVRESETAKIDEKAVHHLVVHTSDPDEPRLQLEYQLRTAPAASRPRARTKRTPPSP